MTTTVACPICLAPIAWGGSSECVAWNEYEQRYLPVSLEGLDPVAQDHTRQFGYVRCPNPYEMDAHVLPAMYGDFDRPLVVGVVGRPAAGKTSLLAAMVYEIFRGPLHAFGVEVSLLDHNAHDQFTARCLTPFLDRRAVPRDEGGRWGYAECLLVKSATGRRPLVLFDVAGADLAENRPAGASTRFLAGADALIFVDAVEYRPGGRSAAAPDVNGPFTRVIDVVRAAPRLRDVAATVAVTKADRVRYAHPVDRWFGRRSLETADGLAAFADETEDAYAYLHSRGVDSAVTPFGAFDRCTMHFVSATGHDAFDVVADPADRPHVVPSGVLRPFVAVLAMTGVLRGTEARRVGT